MKIATILGARPQFIKAAAVSRAIIEHGKFEEVIIHTGQHYDPNMSAIFFDEMNIPLPKHHFSIQEKTHGSMTGRMLIEIEECILEEKPDAILVYGDTNSTLAGALVGSKLHIPVFHVEAGLRSFNMRMPEEVNRILTDRVSTILFCPTKTAVQNLESEGYDSIRSAQVEIVGDVMEDAVLYYSKNNQSSILKDLNLDSGKYYLATIHRAENTDVRERLEDMFAALNQIAESHPVVLPLHPRTKSKLEGIDISEDIIIIDPVGYMDMLTLTQNCSLVFTDSGGLQKEAYFASKFCITMRDETEWVELIDGGYNLCVGADKVKIQQAFDHFTNREFVKKEQLYGGGTASKRIVEKIDAFFSEV